MSDLPAFNLLVVGDLFAPAMLPVDERVTQLAQQGSGVRVALNIPEAIGKCADGWHPDLIVICQQTPDEYAAAEVHALLTAFPLSRCVCGYGRWCASDGRTRDTWPLAVRVPAESAARRIDIELEVIAGTRAPLPLTASRDEIFLFDPEGQIEAPVS